MAKPINRILSAVALSSAVLVVALGPQHPAGAHGGATGVVMERMMVMEGIGKAMKRIAALLKDPAGYDGAELSRVATEIAAAGGDHLTDKFPQGSLDAPTEALPVIWQNWDRFSGLAAALQTEAASLSRAAGQDRAAATRAFAGLAGTCKDCHAEFRQGK